MASQRRGLIWGFLFPSGEIVTGTQGFVENLEAQNEGEVVRQIDDEWVTVDSWRR